MAAATRQGMISFFTDGIVVFIFVFRTAHADTSGRRRIMGCFTDEPERAGLESSPILATLARGTLSLAQPAWFPNRSATDPFNVR
jgi:hypothetical protein